MKKKRILYCIALTLFISSVASAAEVSWISGLQKPEEWTIDPCEPLQGDLINFSGPVGPLINSCFGRIYLGGTPSISIDEINKVVKLEFNGPAPDSCGLIWDPVCGISGQFGPLSPGEWTFMTEKAQIAFEINFTVTASATSGKIYYVDKDSPGYIHNGKIWKWAFRNLQDALEIAEAGDTVFVAEGTYRPDDGGTQSHGDRMATFSPAPGVTLIGSCAGYGHQDPNHQNIDEYTTILSGDLSGNDSGELHIEQDNSYQVVRIAGGMSGKVTINGFLITSGQADGPDLMNSGAGLDIDGSDVMLINTTISGNESGFGGGISCKNATLSMWNCIVAGNKARIYGGGLYNYASDVEMTNCLMTGNSASQAQITGGSAIHNLGGNLKISDCTIADNSINTESSEGKAITSYLWKSPPDSNIVIANSILYNGGNEILTNNTDTVFVSYSDVQGGWTGTGNISKNPQFNNPGYRGNEVQWLNGDYTLKSNSPCIDKGRNSLLPRDKADLDKDGNTSETLPIDLYGNARIRNSIVDMGAYEQAGTVIPPEPVEPYIQDGVWYNVPVLSPGYPPVTLQSPHVTYQISVNFAAIVSLEIVPTSAAGGTWTAWFDPEPGVIGPGTASVTLIVRGENVDISKLSPGYQQIAQLKIYVQPAY